MPKVRIHRPFPELKSEQALASRPASTDVWLSASAGTGKTQVLVARVLRLLLRGEKPEAILCLTFTKAGAAEMANRIAEITAAWVRLDDGTLGADLKNLGEDFGPEARAYAGTLFARVLDARGGGLRIQTIHSFCQSLLGSFPGEAGLVPGFRPIEGREEAALAQSALADMVAGAHRGGELGMVERLKRVSYRMGEDAARTHLKRCAASPDAMEALGPGVEARVRRWLGIGDADPESLLLATCCDDGFDRDCLERIRALNIAWGTGRAMEKVEAITDWLALSPESRAKHIHSLTAVWAKADGEMRSFGKGQAPQHADYAELVSRKYARFNGLLELRKQVALAADISDALIVGQHYARAYADAKKAAGAVDFNDMIAKTVALLETPGLGQWIAYKLDQATDHILVDEAQDTNAAQWCIVKALAEEFFAGEGARGKRVRTLFTVGDYKQAIFGFQGTDPKEFASAQEHFTALARNADRFVSDLSLAHSFRSSQPVLDVVDAVIEAIGHEAFGLDTPPPRHVTAVHGAGSVTLWEPVSSPEDEADDDSEEGWTTSSERVFAGELAKRIRGWIDGGLTLRNEGNRPVRPEDILILVRSRGELARLIVSRLHEEKVEVAGVDRLRLNAPIAVQDLLACIRFVLQPADDLNLAALLVSPLIGWSQDELYEHGQGRAKGVTLWRHLDDARPPALEKLLNKADFSTPHRFLEDILSGEMRGRRRLIARLGEEARDPIEELVNAAIAFEREAPPSLQQFIDWFDRGDVEIKRDPAQPGQGVRVMTVHGAKGLQAPVVILADATGDPDFKRKSDLDWRPEPDLRVPLFRPRKDELMGSLRESAELGDRREREEHWRLLYVAMTRAQEHLFIGGALKPKQAKGMGEDCWHLRIGAAMQAMAPVDDGEGGRRFEGGTPRPFKKRDLPKPEPALTRPDWLDRPAALDARPPRPLAPSAIKPDDQVADPPPPEAQRKAAERGVLLHGLFERLPAVAFEERRPAAHRWLQGARGIADAAQRDELIDAALSVLDHPDLAEVFSAEALTEAPLAGVVAGQVIAGTADRLLIGDDSVTVVDFKTGRRVPADAESVPAHHLAQMSAYAAVLSGIFPDKRVEAALLYSHGPKLITLPPALLARHKPGLSV